MILATALLSINNGLIYVPDARPYQEARTFCKNVYGTELATIITNEDRAEAISDINDTQTDEAWIGLYSNKLGDDGVLFQFLNGDECLNTTNSVFNCIDFWLYPSPRPIDNNSSDEDGYQCAHFKAAQNGVDNDISCDENLPFFCEDGETICNIEGRVQRRYALSNLINNGWKPCYQDKYSSYTKLDDLQSSCPIGPDYYLFVGALEYIDSCYIHIGAFGSSSILTTRTHSRYLAVKPNELVNDINYTVWWYNTIANWTNDDANSFGFSQDSQVYLIPVDYQSTNIEYRLSWYMDTNSGGFSAGDVQGLWRNDNWQKIIYYKQCSGGIQTLNAGKKYYNYIPSGLTKYNQSQIQQVCQMRYGTDLGTIVTDTDVEDAIYIMNNNEITHAWIRLNDQNFNKKGMYYLIRLFIGIPNAQIYMECSNGIYIDKNLCRNDYESCSDLCYFTPCQIEKNVNATFGLLTYMKTGSTKLNLNCDDNIGSYVALCNVR